MKVKKQHKAAWISVLLMLLGLSCVSARPIVIKLGTPTPSGSEWNDVLLQLAEEWEELSDGKVQLKIFPDGVAGNEQDMIRKMKINTLQAAVVSGEGLNGISSFSMVLSLPLLIRSEEEFDYVFDKIRTPFENDIERAGFTMVGWTRAGWLYLYSRNKVLYPRDLKNQKLAAADTDMVVAPILKSAGYTTVSLTLNEIMSALVSGMVDACYTVPLGAVAYQWFGIANNMLDLPMAQAIGGIIVTKRTWDRIPDDIKPKLKEAVDRAVRHLHKLNRETEMEVMDIMKEHGLVVHSVPDQAREEWKEIIARGIEDLIGKVFPREVYDLVVGHVQRFRGVR